MCSCCGCGLFCRYGVIYGCRGRWSWRRPSRQLKSASYTWRKACLKRMFKQMFSKHQGGKNGNSSKVQRAFVLFFALTPAIFINEFQRVFPLMVLVRAWLSCNVSLHCLFVGFHWCASECRRSLSIFTHRRQSLVLRLSFHQVIALALKEISVRFPRQKHALYLFTYHSVLSFGFNYWFRKHHVSYFHYKWMQKCIKGNMSPFLRRIH